MDRYPPGILRDYYQSSLLDGTEGFGDVDSNSWTIEHDVEKWCTSLPDLAEDDEENEESWSDYSYINDDDSSDAWVVGSECADELDAITKFLAERNATLGRSEEEASELLGLLSVDVRAMTEHEARVEGEHRPLL